MTYSKVTGLAAVVAAAVGAVQTQSGAVSLDMAEALAVVALLRCMESTNRILVVKTRGNEKVPYSQWYEEEGSC